MRALRVLAADLRAKALDGLDEGEREQLLETLRVVKGNLLRLNGNGSLDNNLGRQGEGTGAEPRALPAELAPPPRRRARRLIRPLLLVVVPAIVGLFGLYWYAMTGRYVSTENAYVKADMVAISPEVDGRVIAVGVAENQFVRHGDVLFRLDPEPFQIALDMAEAKMLAVRNDVEAWRAEFRQIEAEIGEARERVQFYAHQADRQRELQGRGISTEVRLEEAEVDLMGAQQRVAALQEKLRTVLAKLGGDPASAAELHPMYRQAEAERDMAALNLAMRWCARRSTAWSAGCACSRGNGSRRARRRSASSIQRPPGSRPISRKPSSSTSRSGSRSRSMPTPTRTTCGSARWPASVRRPAPSSR